MPKIGAAPVRRTGRGEAVQVAGSAERSGNAGLEDPTVLKTKPVAAEAVRPDDGWGDDGHPGYILTTAKLVSVASSSGEPMKKAVEATAGAGEMPARVRVLGNVDSASGRACRETPLAGAGEPSDIARLSSPCQDSDGESPYVRREPANGRDAPDSAEFAWPPEYSRTGTGAEAAALAPVAADHATRPFR